MAIYFLHVNTNVSLKIRTNKEAVHLIKRLFK